jgi:hypothetical protein
VKIRADLLPPHPDEHIALEVYNRRRDTDSLAKALEQAAAFFHIYQIRKFVIHSSLKKTLWCFLSTIFNSPVIDIRFEIQPDQDADESEHPQVEQCVQ